ncbi:MAG: LON peptidase substrate-binding domain-containing protein, partial [Chloroflexi bacterium]|nr:LON peptidase substrate-binding domain-containing protein [Chloroflexota bacterium]
MDLTGFGVKDPAELQQIRQKENDGVTVPPELPILPLKNTVIFPLTVLPLIVQKPRSVRLVDDAVVADRMVALVALKDPKIEDPTPDDVYQMGTMAIIHRLARASDGTLHIIVQGLERIRITEFTETEPYMRARIEMAPEVTEEGVEMEALVRSATDLFRRLVGLAAYLPE